MKKLINFIERWLSDNNCHLATHSDASYHYLTGNDFDYNGYSSYQSSVEEAIEDGSIYVDKANLLHICGEVIEL